jgi:hypothetical protein
MLEKYTCFTLKPLVLLRFNRLKSVMKFCYILKMYSQYEVAISFNLSILIHRLMHGENIFHGQVQIYSKLY